MSTPEEILQKLLDDIIKERNYKDAKTIVKPISTGGANYTSVLFIVTISVPDNEDVELFAKVGIVGEKMRSQMPILLYDIERYAYQELLTKYELIQNNHNVPTEERLRAAKFYGCNPTLYEETIVLENLAAKGFTTYDRFKSIDWEYGAKSVETLARFHALSIAYAEQYPEEFKNVLDNMKFQEKAFTVFIEQGLERYSNFAVAAVSENNKEKLKNYLETNVSVEKMVKFYLTSRRPTLCHGDYRPSNLMHRQNEDGTVEVIPVDYQTIQSGAPLIDLMYFIFTGSDENFRRRHFWDLVDHYYRELCSALRNMGLDPRQIYTEDEFDLDIKEILPSGLLIGIFFLPIITVETENAPSIGDGDINSMVDIKVSPYYAERINGIVNDYIRYGIIT
ncbi:uncharacterized protein LOC131842465 [Achroia grisella]|uniref:uncharacterized protein LOC131842465 n=1 Tax=Achroia grisella TaxID=688607 RepID=UPI0027D1F859|nr:uncharacterized protein LOC131842465 [Achroia grisella]